MPNTQNFITNIRRVATQMAEVNRAYEGLFTQLHHALTEAIQTESTPPAQAKVTIKITEEVNQIATEAFPNPQIIACKKGCDACCHLPVTTEPQTAFMIAEHLHQTRTPQEIMLLTAELKKRVDASKPLSFEARQLTREQCIFLNPEGACTIYEVRPLVCRSFTSPDAAHCKKVAFDNPNGVHKIQLHPIHYRFFQGAVTALLAHAKAKGKQADQISLNDGLYTALTTRSAVIKWSNGESIFPKQV